MVNSPISYLVLSDIHLGHSRTSTTDIIHNLDVYFDNYITSSRFSTLDVIFLAGDVFDTLLSYNDPDIHHIHLWFSRLLRFCYRNKIILRILEGTPSHDWKQSKTLLIVSSQAVDQGNVRYIDTLCIEHIVELDLQVLYVPDEWNSSADITLTQVTQLLADNSLEQVDIAIMHGMFAYQCGWVNNNPHCHDIAAYLAIVKYWINIGHIHQHSVNDRVVAEGSFDRLAHGEEEAKGGVLMTLDIVNGNRYEFMPNLLAKRYITIIVKWLDLDRAIGQIDKVIDRLPNDSYVRIKAKSSHPIYVAFDDIKRRYPLHYLSKQTLEDDSVSVIADITAVLSEDYVPITITPDNIVSLLLTAVKTSNELNDVETKALTELLVVT